MNNGLIVERKGKNSDLKVIDPSGQKGGQQLLNSFVEELAIDLPKFMESTSKEKANILLQIIGVGDQLFELEREEQEVYNRRHAIGQIADQKKKFAMEMKYFPEAPKIPVSVSELVAQQQDILARNGENQRKREQVKQISFQLEQIKQNENSLIQRINELQEQLSGTQAQRSLLENDLVIAQKTAETLHDESTAELEKSIADVDEINSQVRVNLDKEKAEEDAEQYREQYETLTASINEIRARKESLLHDADLPLPGLSVDDGELTYKGQRWDNMSGSEQLQVSTAIVRKLKPECGFILLDKLEQMDMNTLNEFGQWLEQEGLQAIATRVSTGDECSIVIEDGYSVSSKEETVQQKFTTSGWAGKGAF